MSGRALVPVGLIVVIGAAILLLWPRFEGDPPEIVAPERIVLGAEPRAITIEISDPGSGIREFSTRISHGAGTGTLEEGRFGGGMMSGGTPDSHAHTIELELDAKALGVPDGPATLVVDVRDWSLREATAGNRAELSIPIVVDTRAPRVSALSGLTYMRRGGAAAAVYRLSEEAPRHGARVGGAFFPGYPHPEGDGSTFIVIFGVPVDAPENPVVDLIAEDAAGNLGHTRFDARIMERKFSKSDIRIDESFLERVAVPLARAAQLSFTNPTQAFQEVNTELRARNEAQIREYLADSGEKALFSGGFGQLAGSKVMSRFAEERFYFLRGEEISQARHYGFDLASTAQAPITATAAGVVRFAGDLGIYGRCVLLDHGLGVSSLYGHLSSIDVKPGDAVAKGDRLGRSGATGLAGGDHLHFAILAGQTYVDPMEWWDAKWVRTHIEVRLESVPR